MDFTDDDISTLGDKLAALDLTDGERDALRTVAAVAAASSDAEVSGFARRPTTDFGSLGIKLGPPRGKIIHTGDEIELRGFVVVEGEVT